MQSYFVQSQIEQKELYIRIRSHVDGDDSVKLHRDYRGITESFT